MQKAIEMKEEDWEKMEKKATTTIRLSLASKVGAEDKSKDGEPRVCGLKFPIMKSVVEHPTTKNGVQGRARERFHLLLLFYSVILLHKNLVITS
ncbi:hypothetical protein AKJ16_DCAP23727 [Drosera capensis]